MAEEQEVDPEDGTEEPSSSGGRATRRAFLQGALGAAALGVYSPPQLRELAVPALQAKP